MAIKQHVYNKFNQKQYTANSIKVVLPNVRNVNYERAKDDRLLLIFTPKFGIMSTKHLRGHRKLRTANSLATKVIP